MTDLKVVRPKGYNFIDQLIDAVKHHAEKQRKKIVKEHYEAASKLEEGIDELNQIL